MKQIYWLLLLLFVVSCADNDGIGSLREERVIRFEFPQGDESWDQEIQQIAQDWGMYIIYKDVDSTDLNRTTWMTSSPNAPIYTSSTPSAEEIQLYVELVQEWLLGNLDKNRETDKASLPLYLYLVNDFQDVNPSSTTYGEHIQLFQGGLDFWSLSFTSEEIESGLTPEMIHGMATGFVYPGIKAKILSGEYAIPGEFSVDSDYETPIGTRYISLEDYAASMGLPPFMADMVKDVYEMGVPAYEKDEDNAFMTRGFAVYVDETFVERGGMSNDYGAPTWMPWIADATFPGNLETPPSDVNDRIKQDFLNMIRVALTFTEEEVREKYPVSTTDVKEAAGFQIINDKYDVVTGYMLENYGIDLKRYANILTEK